MMKVPEQYRVKSGPFSSDESYGNNGAFSIPYQSYIFTVIASDGIGWEHVSVSLSNRTPNWAEMCFIKDLFWDKEDLVVQYHPPHSEYVNNHQHCLHLWRPTQMIIPAPPSIMTGLTDRFVESITGGQDI